MGVNKEDADFAVVTCADGKMLPAACCALLSVRNNLVGSACFFLVLLDSNDSDVEALKQFSSRQDIDINVISFDSARLPEIETLKWPKAVLTRLFLDNIISPRIRRLLYLDADTLAVATAEPLRHVDLGTHSVAAVDDYIMAFPDKMRMRRDALELADGSPYFNSGVMLFDWQNPDARHALATARVNLADCSTQYHATDQDALNAAFQGKWARLDARWNAQTGFMNDIADPAIVHFTGRRKPWQPQATWQQRKYSELYRSWMNGTAWEASAVMPNVGRQIESAALHLGKKFAGLPKARKVTAYLEKTRPINE